MQKKTIISIIIGIAIILGAFLSVFGSSLKNLSLEEASENPDTSAQVDETVVQETKQETKITTPATKPTTTQTDTSLQSGTYTMVQVATHNSATSCWSAINGSVYDLTSWVNRHPGGKAAILMICGKDGSALFNAQHGGSNKVASVLASFHIGHIN